MDVRLSPSKLNGSVEAISSKSDMHRMLIAAALSNEPTVINCNIVSEDIAATISCLEALGSKISIDVGKITVTPIEKPQDNVVLDCYESGSTLRFLLPVAAALGIKAQFSGGGRLASRPILPLRNELESNGVKISPPWQFPIEISGQLEAGEFAFRGDVSSQLATGLLMALPILDGDSKLKLFEPVVSRQYIDLTLKVLKQFGIEIKEENNEFFIKGNQKYISPKEITAEGDWSNSAFFLAAGAMSDDVTVTGLDVNSLQGDKKILDLLKEVGANVSIDDNKITVSKNNLKGITVDVKDIPDLVPIMSVVGAMCESGITVISSANQLRLKEYDRLAALGECLNNMGNVNAETDDGLIVWSGDKFRGGEVFSFDDHLIIMSMAIAAANAQNETVIKNADAINKSYPTFFVDYKKLGGKVDVINNEG